VLSESIYYPVDYAEKEKSMSKREIEAASVKVEGDFIAVETKSTRGAAAIGGAIIGTLIAPGAGTVIGGLLGGAAGEDGGTKLIPKSDVVEIKRDSSGKVTVVVDEERGKRR